MQAAEDKKQLIGHKSLSGDNPVRSVLAVVPHHNHANVEHDVYEKT
jgi:hypothetical protein